MDENMDLKENFKSISIGLCNAPAERKLAVPTSLLELSDDSILILVDLSTGCNKPCMTPYWICQCPFLYDTSYSAVCPDSSGPWHRD